MDPSGTIRTRDLGRGDSRVLCAKENGCLVSCAASEGTYPLLLVNERLETVREGRLGSPVTAALPLDAFWLLLPSKQALGQLWLWDGNTCTPIKQRLLYQDQAQFGRLGDGSLAMLSAGTILRFAFSAGGKSGERGRTAESDLPPEELPDLRRYELQNTKLCAIGDYACLAGVSMSTRSVRDEQAAGAVFLKKERGRWRVLGARTWPRSLERIRAVCIDPESGRFTLLFRSADSIHWVLAVQGTAEELCAERGLARELRLPQNKENFGCFAGGKLFFSAGELLQAYDAQTLRYETALLLPAPITAILPRESGVDLRYGAQTVRVEIQEGAMT